MYQAKSLNDLLDIEDPAWPLVQTWLKNSRNDVVVLEPQNEIRDKALVSSQVTTRSPLGAIIYETGGILIDKGWIRVLGSGSPEIPRPIHKWNYGRGGKEFRVKPGLFLVADDPVGGFFALNGGALGEDAGNVYYHGPDTLEWESLEMGYSAFIQWILTPNLEEWSSSLRWPGWENEIEQINGDQGILITPPLIAQGPSIQDRHIGVVPVSELYILYVDENAPTDITS